MGDKRLFVYKNQAGSEGKVVLAKPGDNFTSFKTNAGKKLNIRAKRIFLQTGAEIHSMDELQNNDTLYISTGEPFYKHAPVSSGQEIIQLSVLGSGGVGKSALTLRFVRDYFVRDWDPTIEDAYRKTIQVQNQVSLLEILDTAGQDDFESLRAQWMMDKDAYVFVYSMDSRTSLHELQPFFELHQQVNENKRPLPPIILVANKRDVIEQDSAKCQVTTEEGRRIAQAYNAKYIETSALSGENVPAVFETLVLEVRKNRLAKLIRRKSRLCAIL
ncbi:ras [Thraustotheca clavata]|uniref:Ras n=1 Tax=Thraustotheca clavata TaxID=74557 RepID=A0A1V9ZCQ3_9STRA|nr:ras [Thraustotheca clavata]